MNTRTIALTLAMLPGMALASPPHQASVYVNCSDPQLPTQQEVAGLTGADNLSQVYDLRNRLMVEIDNLCHRRGGGEFQLVINLRDLRDRQEDKARLASR